MPNIWTHMLFCEDIIDAVEAPNRYTRYEPYMKLGAQGPDPFFYYNFWPWMKESQANEIGTLIHTKKCGPFLMELIERAKDSHPIVQAYVFGFITHHILDRHAHPYIHYRAGYKGNDHQKLEVFIDTIMMVKYHSLKTWKVPVHKEINVGFSIQKEVTQLLHEAIKTHFPEITFKTPSYIQKAYKDMKRALKILSDPYGWKNVVLKSLISAYSHRPIKNDVDYLNMSHTTWYHPATNEPCNKSFVDLYNEGRIEGITILSEVIRYWHQEQDILTDIADLLGDISYDTGKPLSLHLENKYSDPII